MNIKMKCHLCLMLLKFKTKILLEPKQIFFNPLKKVKECLSSLCHIRGGMNRGQSFGAEISIIKTSET